LLKRLVVIIFVVSIGWVAWRMLRDEMTVGMPTGLSFEEGIDAIEDSIASFVESVPIPGPINPDYVPPVSSSPGWVGVPVYDGPLPDNFRPQRTYLAHGDESNGGFGNVENFTTLQMELSKDYNPGHFLSMVDLRIHSINSMCKDNTYGASVGLVERYIPSSSCRMWGFNGFWDYRQGSLGQWHQLGLGVETLGKRWDFRANGYWPLEDAAKKTCVFDDFSGGFFMKTVKFESAFAGVNAEVGWKPIRSRNFQLYAAAGPYYISGDCSKAWGGRARLRPQYQDVAAIEGIVSYDHIFGVIYQVQVIFSIPLYRDPANHRRAPCDIYNREVFQPVERWDIILLDRGSCTFSNF